MSKRRKRLAALGTFVDEYARKKRHSFGLNDPQYSRKFEEVVKRLDPAEFQELLDGEAEMEHEREEADEG